MKNFQTFAVGNNISAVAAYALASDGKLGAITMSFENITAGNGNNSLLGSPLATAPSTATLTIKSFVPSGTVDSNGVEQGTWTQLVAPFTVAPGGKVDKQATVFAKKIGVFGSGNTLVNMHVHHTYAAAFRPGTLEVVPAGRQGWGFDPGVDRTLLFPENQE